MNRQWAWTLWGGQHDYALSRYRSRQQMEPEKIPQEKQIQKHSTHEGKHEESNRGSCAALVKPTLTTTISDLRHVETVPNIWSLYRMADRFLMTLLKRIQRENRRSRETAAEERQSSTTTKDGDKVAPKNKDQEGERGLVEGRGANAGHDQITAVDTKRGEGNIDFPRVHTLSRSPSSYTPQSSTESSVSSSHYSTTSSSFLLPRPSSFVTTLMTLVAMAPALTQVWQRPHPKVFVHASTFCILTSLMLDFGGKARSGPMKNPSHWNGMARGRSTDSQKDPSGTTPTTITPFPFLRLLTFLLSLGFSALESAHDASIYVMAAAVAHSTVLMLMPILNLGGHSQCYDNHHSKGEEWKGEWVGDMLREGKALSWVWVVCVSLSLSLWTYSFLVFLFTPLFLFLFFFIRV